MMKVSLVRIISLCTFMMISYCLHNISTHSKYNTPVIVGVLLSDSMYVHEKSYHGLIERLNQPSNGVSYSVKPFYFHSLDTININSMAEALLESSPDVVVTIGSMGTLALAELMRKRMNKIPHVFIGVTNSVELGIVASLEHPGDNITGVMTGGFDKELMAHFLYAAKPTARRVLIPYDLTKDFDCMSSSTAAVISDYLHAKGIDSLILPIAGQAEAIKMITNTINGCDVVMGLEIDSLVSISGALVKVCSEHQVTCFTATVEGADYGAVFAFGSQPLFTGAAAGDVICNIIEGGKAPARYPVVRLDNTRQFIINTSAAHDQDMTGIDMPFIIDRIASDPVLVPFISRLKVIERGC